MRSRRLRELCVPGAHLSVDAPIAGIAPRADEVRAGDALWLTERAGDRAQAFADQAKAKGAAALVLVGDIKLQSPLPTLRLPSWEMAGKALRNWFGTQQSRTRWIAVVGTDGKTSVAWYLRMALARFAGSAWSRGTLGLVRDEAAIEPRPNTTPSMLELHALWQQAQMCDVPWIVAEVSSHGIAQHRVVGIEFAGCVFTTLGRDHAEDHGGVEKTWQIKANFVRAVAEHGGVVVGNAGHPLVRTRLPKGAWRYAPYGDVAAQLHWDVPAPGALALWREGKRYAVEDVPAGRLHAENLAAAAAALMAIARASISDAARCLCAMPAVPGRMQQVIQGVWLDYAHTPEALSHALSDLRARTKGQLFVVFGCGGERDHGKRPQMGRIAAEMADRVWITTDNPRSEPAEAIANEILAGVPQKLRSKVHIELDRARAIGQAVRLRGDDDAVLVAGKGIERTIEIGDARIPWSDEEVIRQAAKEAASCA